MKKALVLALIAILIVPQLLAESAAGRAESAAAQGGDTSTLLSQG